MSIHNLSEKILDQGGILISFLHKAETIKPGTTRNVTVYLPAAVHTPCETAVQVYLDGMRDPEPAILEKLIADGSMPPTVTIGITAAGYPASLPGGTDRSVRSPEYDGLGSSLADYIIDVLIPEIAALIQPRGYTFSTSPNWHSINGCSSGGIASWNACWERNDYFRRCFMASPTFSSFRGGDSLPFLMRKFETKKIRTFMTAGTNDMRNSAGDWYLEALTAAEALKFAGYEYAFQIFKNGCHGVGSCDPAIMERAMIFIWKNWRTTPVSFLHFPPRVADLISPETEWTQTNEPMPSPTPCPYTFSGNKIFLKDRVVENTEYPISALALSSDKWRLYVATTERRMVYAYAIQPDGSLKDPYSHAHLHLKDDFRKPGAYDICIDSFDRLYAATETGIQTISHNGETNTLLTLPGNKPVTAIAFSGSENKDLFAETSDGIVFKRPFLTEAPDDRILPPCTPSF